MSPIRGAAIYQQYETPCAASTSPHSQPSRLRTTDGISAATQSPLETTFAACHSSEASTIVPSAASHDRSRHNLPDRKGRPLQMLVIRGRHHVSRLQREPDAPQRIAFSLRCPDNSQAAPACSRQPGIGEPCRWRFGFGHRGNASECGIGKPTVTTRRWSWALRTPTAGTPGATTQRRLALRCETYMPQGKSAAPPTGWDQPSVSRRRLANRSRSVANPNNCDAATNSRRRNFSAIRDAVRSDNFTNPHINAAPNNGWLFTCQAGA